MLFSESADLWQYWEIRHAGSLISKLNMLCFGKDMNSRNGGGTVKFLNSKAWLTSGTTHPKMQVILSGHLIHWTNIYWRFTTGRGLFWCRESMDIKAKSAIICYGKKMSPRSHRDMRKWAGAQAHPALRYLPSAGLSELFCCNRPVFIKDGVGFPSSVWLLENRSKTLFLHGELSRRGLAKGNR